MQISTKDFFMRGEGAGRAKSRRAAYEALDPLPHFRQGHGRIQHLTKAIGWQISLTVVREEESVALQLPSAHGQQSRGVGVVVQPHLESHRFRVSSLGSARKSWIG